LKFTDIPLFRWLKKSWSYKPSHKEQYKRLQKRATSA
jgi:hypothetical protein